MAYQPISNGAKAIDDVDNAGAEVTVDTTIDNMVDVTLQWSEASTTRSITTTIATVMLV